MNELTGLYNRRYFEEDMDTSMMLSRQTNVTLLLILLAIDHFKQIL